MTDVSESGLLPWQRDFWQQIAPQMAAPKHHAWLLHGPAGIGKWQLAVAIARARLCLARKPDGHACGQCAACKLHTTHAHPDLLTLVPEALRVELGLPEPEVETGRKPSKDIQVDDVRAVVQAFTRSTHLGVGRVCLVCPAESMNTASANTLLKTLEEPPSVEGGVLFVVVSHQPQHLLATVRSRCLAMPAPQPDSAKASAWLAAQGVDKAQAAATLAMVGNRPLAAMAGSAATSGALALVAFVARKQWQAAAKFDSKTLGNRVAVEALMRWVNDVGQIKGSGRKNAGHFPSLSKECADWASATPWPALRRMQSALLAAARIADHPVNSALFIEALLVRLQDTSAVN